MGDMSYYGDTGTTWTDGNDMIWISSNPSSYYHTVIKKKDKKKEFIDEEEFKV